MGEMAVEHQQRLSEVRDGLLQIVGPDRLSTADAERALHGRDQSSHPMRPPDIVVWPEQTSEVSEILRLANARGVPVTGWGAGTSLEGNPIPRHGGIVVDFRRMNQLLAVHEMDFQVTVQPGLLYKDMNRQLAAYGLFFPPDPGANASIGGMLANNAAGIRTVKYGATRDNVLALEVVLADGEVIRTGSRAVKQSAGYDLTHLFVGSEGTLGLITAATLRLAPLPEQFSAVTAAFPTVAQAAQAVFDLMGSGLEPAALELLDRTAVQVMNSDPAIDLPVAPILFIEFHGASSVALAETLRLAEAICQENGCQSYQSGLGRDARARLWEARHRLFEIHVRYYAGDTYLLADVAVPISRYPALVSAAAEMMRELAVKGSIFGHAGDGNLHTSFFFPADDGAARGRAQQLNDRLVELAISLDGTSTGEHGVGIGKQKYMRREHGPGALNLMRRLKHTLDPNNILNPGKILPPADA